jgi:pimeloyl-ACP methyl ester carboxylesterase
MVHKLPVVFLPGLLCDEALWRNQIKSLESLANCHVASIVSEDNMAALARSVLSNAPPQFAMAGLSMGGYVAQEIMRQAPDRVLKLCLLDTSARADTPEQRSKRQLLLTMSKTGQFKGVTPRLLPLLIHKDRLNDQELTITITAMAERVGRQAFHNQQTAILNRIDSRSSLKDIRCPVQIICGSDDALTPPEVMREFAEAIPQARYDIIADCGHLSPLEKSTEVTDLLKRWLAN